MPMLKEILTKSNKVKTENESYIILSCSRTDGLVPQSEKYNKQIASEDTSKYLVVSKNTLVQTFHMDQGVLAVWENDELGLVSPAYKVWVINTNYVVPKYLELLLKSPAAMNYYMKHAKTTVAGRCAVNDDDFLNFDIVLPNIEQQYKVVRMIDKINRIINQGKKHLDLYDELVKSRFIELFGDPVKNNMGWESKPLNDVCDGIGDGLHGTPEYDEGGEYPFINGNNLLDGEIIITPATKMVAAKTFEKHFIDISTNAILISINGTLGKLAFYNGEKVMLGKSACYCNLKQDINKVFVYGVMKSDAFAEFLENSSTKSTIKNVGLKAMREFRLILPPMELQEQFAAFVEQVDKSKLATTETLKYYEELKSALMNKYFN